MNGFARIRNGIKRHIEGRDGVRQKLGSTTLGVYVFLHLYCDYDTGIYRGNVPSIANTLGDSVPTVRDALHRLRDRYFINFKATEGKGAIYDILIDKFEPTFGTHYGHRLNAWTSKDLPVPVYEKIEGERGNDVGSTSDERGSSVGLTPHSQTPIRADVQTSRFPEDGGEGRVAIPTPKLSVVTKQDGLAGYFLSLMPDQKLSQMAYVGSLGRWNKLALKIVREGNQDHVKKVMDYALNGSAFWADKILSVQRVDPMEYLIEKFGDIEAKMLAEERSNEIRNQKAREVATQTKKAAALAAGNADKPAYRQVPGKDIVKDTDVEKF